MTGFLDALVGAPYMLMLAASPAEFMKTITAQIERLTARVDQLVASHVVILKLMISSICSTLNRKDTLLLSRVL